jgi:hypothetical protein
MNNFPDVSQGILDNFLTFLQDPSIDENAYSKLSILETRLAETEDKPTKVALTIQTWCKEFKIDFSQEKLESVRANMLKKGETIPKSPEGDSPRVIYNKALLVEEVNKAIAARSNDKT